MYRFFRVLVILVVAMLLILPGAASANALAGSINAPQAPLFLTWTQRNVSSFGDVTVVQNPPKTVPNNAAVSALEFFNGKLYAGTTNDNGAQIWATADGDHWSRVSLPGFATYGHGVTFDLIVFHNQLYAGIGTWYDLGATGEIWRTANGANWERVTGAWEQNVHNVGISNFAIFGGALYATTNNLVNGIEVYRSFTGNTNDWERVDAAGSFVATNPYQVATGLATFNNSLYVALTGQTAGDGARIYRTSDGTNWTAANAPGFGNTAYYWSGGFAVHNGYLYVGVGTDDNKPNGGGQIWRTSDGANWTQVGTNGFGDPHSYTVEGLVSTQGTLFAFTRNDTTGTQVWSSPHGTDWVPSNTPGFGSVYNKAVALWSNGSGTFSNQLFLGTFNQEVGGQVWSATPPVVAPLDKRTFLPFVTH